VDRGSRKRIFCAVLPVSRQSLDRLSLRCSLPEKFQWCDNGRNEEA
jgi:hypothetical protein